MKDFNKLEFKRKILDAGIKKHQSVIDDYKTRIKEMQNSELMKGEDKFDDHQQAFNETTNYAINLLANELLFANKEMATLYNIQVGETTHDKVQLGSVIITDSETFFVSVSIERFHVDGKEIFGLSTEAPIYRTMEGKMDGDTFEYQGKVYHIKDVF